MPGPNWVILVSQGAALLDRAYHLVNRTSPYPGGVQLQSGRAPARPAAPPADWQQVLHALQTAHRVLDALEGKPPPRRGLFW